MTRKRRIHPGVPGAMRTSRPRRGPFRRLSDRTPLRTKLIVSVLSLVIIALAAIGVASTYIARESLITQHDVDIASDHDRPT